MENMAGKKKYGNPGTGISRKRIKSNMLQRIGNMPAGRKQAYGKEATGKEKGQQMSGGKVFKRDTRI